MRHEGPLAPLACYFGRKQNVGQVDQAYGIHPYLARRQIYTQPTIQVHAAAESPAECSALTASLSCRMAFISLCEINPRQPRKPQLCAYRSSASEPPLPSKSTDATIFSSWPCRSHQQSLPIDLSGWEEYSPQRKDDEAASHRETKVTASKLVKVAIMQTRRGHWQSNRSAMERKQTGRRNDIRRAASAEDRNSKRRDTGSRKSGRQVRKQMMRGICGDRHRKGR